MARVFSTDWCNIAVIGSAKYGFSLAPQKAFSKFNTENSDLDIVIVSRGIFRDAWHNLRRAHYRNSLPDKKAYIDDVFRRFVSIKSEDFIDTKYLRNIMLLMDHAQKVATTQMGIS